MGPDTGQTIPFGVGHLIPNLGKIIDLAILGARVRISNFPLQIWNLLEK
jgi:hypothetical protein